MKLFLSSIFLMVASSACAAGLTFSSAVAPIEVKPAASTGLDMVYVLPQASGVTASFTTSDSRAVKWYRFGESGGAYAEPVSVTTNGNVTTYTLSSDDSGFIIEQGTTRNYFWVVNYANHPFTLSDLSVSDDSDCSSTMLLPDGKGDRILFYSITGAPTELSREIEASYYTLEYDVSTEVFRQVTKTVIFNHMSSQMRVPAPLCDTSFTLSGDRFLKAWNREVSAETGNYHAIAVEAHTSAEQAMREVDNESRVEVDGLGGSAPVDITFKAVVTDAVRFNEWQFSRDPEFNSYDLRYSDTEVSYTFNEAGVTYVRFQASNNDGSCDWFSETYQVMVGESKLLCPNAFSPNGDGVNDEWKVSYRSIVEFDCTIFNRWGVEIIHLTDPSQGWDGKVHGKTAPSGVYYYVIKARGSDGYKYNLSGDINIINSKQHLGTSTEE